MPQGRPKSVPEDLLPPRVPTIAEYAAARLGIHLEPSRRAAPLDAEARGVIDACALVLEAEARYQPGLPPDSLRLHVRGIVRGLARAKDLYNT